MRWTALVCVTTTTIGFRGPYEKGFWVLLRRFFTRDLLKLFMCQQRMDVFFFKFGKFLFIISNFLCKLVRGYR